jgi:hypothetical protein
VERHVQRRRDHQGEERRRQERHEQLARCARGELETPPRERPER